MKHILHYALVLITVASCEPVNINPGDIDPGDPFLAGDGVFIVNEGNYTWGNGSLSYFSYDSSKVRNEAFRKANGRPLGDVPNSINIIGSNAYIVVNNSGKVEVVKKNSLESVTTITELNSPRFIVPVDSRRAYVSSLFSDSLTIIDLVENSVSGYINIRRTSESIVTAGNKAFVSNWFGGDEVMVVDVSNGKVIDSIKVGREPEGMVIDRNLILWVLCNGGWARENFAELVGINTNSHEIVKRHLFPSILDSPSGLAINGGGDTLYYIHNGIRRMGIGAESLPTMPFIEQNDYLFYKMGVNPVNGDIFVTDAVDYQEKGNIYIYNKRGLMIKSYPAGIIPGNLCFKVSSGIIF